MALLLVGIGRPFLIDATARLASVATRSDWSFALEGIGLPRDAQRRAELAERWTRIALMEHASIAAFARFNLQLLALGAPPELVELTHRALADETRHAQQCFGLASRFAGQAVGPGLLSMSAALNEASTLRAIARNVLLEGCIGETVAAAEAAWARDRSGERTLATLLAGIAADEAEHARLAWKFVAWAIERDDALAAELRSLAEQALEQARDAAASANLDDDDWVASYGLVPGAVATRVKVELLEEVVLPCLRQLSCTFASGLAA